MMIRRATGRLPDADYLTRPAVAAEHPLLAVEPVWTPERRGIGFMPYLGQNDVRPTCTATAVMNMLRWVAILQGFDLGAVEDAIQQNYADMLGIPNTEAAIMASNGAVVADAMKYVGSPGYDTGLWVYDGIARRIPTDQRSVANAIAAWGGVISGIGVDPAISLDGSVWRAGPKEAEDHCVPLFNADGDDIEFATWGAMCRMGWDYWAENGAEAWVVVFPQLVKADGTYFGRPINDIMAAFEAV